MDFDEIEKKLNKLSSLESLQENSEALSIITHLQNSLKSEKSLSADSDSAQATLNLTSSGKIKNISEKACRVLQIPENSSSNLLDLVHPDYKSNFLIHLTEPKQEEYKPTLYECPILYNEDYKWFQMMFLYNRQTQLHRLLITDIHEYKTLESDYQHQSDFISKIIEHIPVGIFCREPNGQFILWSQKCEEMFGYSSEQTLRKTAHDIFNQNLADTITKDDDAVKLAQQNIENTIVLEENGQSKTIRIIKTPFLENNQAVMSIGICEDITSKLELENKNKQLLLEKEELRVRQELENIISRSEFMIYNLSLKPTPHISYISPNVEKITGYSPKDFQNNASLLLSSSDEETNTYLNNILIDSCPIRISKEYPYKTANGSTIWLRNDATLEIKDGSRQLIGSCINITETKIMEEEKNNAIDATRVKSEFLAHMSHEIRTPINGVLGLNSLLLKTNLNEEQNYYVELIHKSASSLLEIINDILDISKIESGKLQLEMREFNLHKFLNETLEIMEVQAKQKGLRFDIQLGELPLRVIGDSKHLGQIIRNLVNNALKFTKEGFISVQARELSCHHEKCTLEFEVKDSGIGIAKDKLDSIFSSFTQATDSTTRQYGGSGLGLSICKKLIELMNGKITVKSRQQKGTSFIFQIAMDLSQKQLVTQINLPLNITMSSFDEPSNEKAVEILIVEDNDINQLVLSGLLKKLGTNKITCASNGQIGLDKFKEGHFDIVFMDCQMPVMDGFAATRSIRNLPEAKSQTPIIAITANAMTTAREECLNAGMSEYITKPIQETQLKEVYDRFTAAIKTKQSPQQKAPTISPEFDFDDSNLRALEDSSLVEQVITSYDSAMVSELQKLHQAFEKQDFDDSKFVIHSIQGLSGNIGAMEVYKKAKKLSSQLNELGFQSCTHTLQSLVKSDQDSKVVLENFLKEYK